MVFKAKVDGLDVGLFDHSIRLSHFQCDCVRSQWYLLLFTNAGPNDLVVEKNTNVGHISFLFLDSKFIGPSKNLYNQK